MYCCCDRYNRAVVGKKAEENRGLLTLKYPIENGIVTDWDNMVKVWGHIYEKGALSDTTAIPSEEHPVSFEGWMKVALCTTTKNACFTFAHKIRCF